MTRLATLVLLLAAAGPLASQSTLVVPGQFSTIQSAINAATSGDTVLVTPGTYVENVVINGKAIVLESLGGPDATFIDGGASGTTLSIENVQDYSARVEGFTIQNGMGGLAPLFGDGAPGGIELLAASLTIRDCVVRNNRGGDAPNGSTGATTVPPAGTGGIALVDSFPHIEDCEIRDNLGGTGTTGLVTISPTLPPFVVAGAAGTGGLHARSSGVIPQPVGFEFTLTRCRITGNLGGNGQSSLFGGPQQGGTAAINVDFSSFFMTECLVAENVGGQAVGSYPTSVATGNNGGCVRIDASGQASLDQVTVTNNSDCSHEVAVVLLNNVEIRNSIVRDNPGVVVELDLLSGAMASFCNVGGGAPGAGNVDLPSSFVASASGDYALDVTSALRDLGDPSATTLPGTDLGGGFRWVGAAPEMGCYEIDDLDGSAEDFQLRTVVNGAGDADFPTKLVTGGDTVVVSFSSDGGTFSGGVPALFVQVFANGTQPASPSAFPELEINDQGGTIVLFDGNVFGPALLGFQPYVFTYALPSAFGVTARFQAAVFSGISANGIFATTRAHDLIFP